MNITLVGAGYVGLVTAVGFAAQGHQVTCVDIDAARVARLQRGELPLHEPGLGPLLEQALAASRIRFTTHLPDTLPDADAVFVAVGTPARTDGRADVGAVLSVARTVAAHAASPLVLVLKSTVPVGTHAQVRALVAGSPADVQVVSNPEFLREGSAVEDFLHPDRVVLGLRPRDRRAVRLMQALYAPLAGVDRIFWMNPESAELTKYVANTMLAMRISFMNEVATLCERLGADVRHVRKGAGSDARIGPHFLHAGPGYGGSCFPKDVRALVATARQHGQPMHLAATTHDVNERHKRVLRHKLRQLLGSLGGRRIAVWGASFKPGTDDIRESPALELVQGLLDDHAEVVVHDPAAGRHLARRFDGRIRVVDDAWDAPVDADALVLVTDWRQYRDVDFVRLGTLLRQRILVDGRNLWCDRDPWQLGFTYAGMGVPVGRPAQPGSGRVREPAGGSDVASGVSS